MHSIPRPILRWIQELDLTYSIKNPARDLANGYSLAELVSRYFPAEISIRSFDPGISLGARRDNWAQLLKVLKKNNIHSLRDNLVEEVIYFKEGAAVAALIELYAALTSRKKPSVITSGSSDVPCYAKPTASLRVKDPSLDRTVDDTQRKLKTMSALIDHESQLRRERPLSMTTRIRNRSAKRSVELHPISNDETGASVEVKYIEIKAFSSTQNSEFIATEYGKVPDYEKPDLRSILENIFNNVTKDGAPPSPGQYWFLVQLVHEVEHDPNFRVAFKTAIEADWASISESLEMEQAGFFLLFEVLRILREINDEQPDSILNRAKNTIAKCSPSLSRYFSTARVLN
jgi:hypothetical protein